MPRAATVKPTAPTAMSLKTMASTPRVKIDLFDKSKPYGELHPIDPNDGAAYKQPPTPNGVYYKMDGARVYRDTDPKPAAPAKTAATGTVTQMPDDVQTSETEGPDAVPEVVDVIEGDVNISAWVAGLASYRFAQVRQAISARYAKEVTDEAEARDFLAGEGIVKPKTG